MPIYEEEGKLTREDLFELKRWNVCKECGGRLDVFYDFDDNKAYLACNDYSRTQHEGIEREPSLYEKEGIEALNIPRRREIMEQDFGAEKSRALSKYVTTRAITKSIATEIVETLWGKAPMVEKNKCILLCLTYQLNPLMRHIYLIGYKRKENGQLVKDGQGKQVYDWSIQMGIGATRLLAQRKHNYSYLDMTPRMATDDEIRKILGPTADKDSIYGFVHIKDQDTGAEAYGLRGIKKTATIVGEDKGNTHLNQACVRAERQALDRQYPGEMPADVEVIDERYIEGEFRVVDDEEADKGKPEDESKAEEREPQSAPHGICPIHNVPLVAGKGNFPPYCPNKVEGTGRSAGKKVWCKGVAPDQALNHEAAVEKEAEQVPQQAEPAPVTNSYIDMAWLEDALKTLKGKGLVAWADKAVLEHMKTAYNVEAETVLLAVAKLDRGMSAHFVNKVQETLEMA